MVASPPWTRHGLAAQTRGSGGIGAFWPRCPSPPLVDLQPVSKHDPAHHLPLTRVAMHSRSVPSHFRDSQPLPLFRNRSLVPFSLPSNRSLSLSTLNSPLKLYSPLSSLPLSRPLLCSLSVLLRGQPGNHHHCSEAVKKVVFLFLSHFFLFIFSGSILLPFFFSGCWLLVSN